MIRTSVGIVLALASASGEAFAVRAADLHGLSARPRGPEIEVWLSSDGYYHRGERAWVHFRTQADAFVTVFRIDTDGRVAVLFPRAPWQDNYVGGGREYQVLEPYGGRGDYSFVVDEYPGQGYVFAVASYDPFDYSPYTRRDRWDYGAFAFHGRVTGDPYVAFDAIVGRMLLPGYADYGYDVYPYYVERRYAYPRFLCYDCHEHVAYTYWNPYRNSCVQFRLVIYDDPYYYPARVYAGTRVVYRRPVRYEPRYVFKDRSTATEFITRERRGTADPGPDRRVLVERGATARDVGGVGRVPVPRIEATRTREPVDDVTGRRPAPQAEQQTEPEERRQEIVEPRGYTEGTAPARPQLERREAVGRPGAPAAREPAQQAAPPRAPRAPEVRRPAPDARTAPTKPTTPAPARDPRAAPQRRRP